MSLDVYLEIEEPSQQREAIFIRRDGSNVEISRDEWDGLHPGREPVIATINGNDTTEVFSGNVTHNLTKMADAAGLYKACWRPEEIGIETAAQLIEPLSAGLARLQADPAEFRKLNPENGWGSYEGLVSFVSAYLDACREYPTARVRVWR